MSDQALPRTVARVSHDLRQPLQTLHALIDVLRRQIRDPEALKLVDRQEIAVNAMVALLDEFDNTLGKE